MWYEILTPVIAGLIRNLSGWIESSLKDGEVSVYEWTQLGATVVKTVVLSIGLMYGLNMDPLMASAATVAFQVGISEVKRITA